MKIGIKDFRVQCIIGCLPEEEEAEQEIQFDIEVTPRHSHAKEDRIDEAVNYLSLKESAEEIAKRGKFRLIESLAYAIADDLLDKLPISSVSIEIRKPAVLTGAAYAYASLQKEAEN